MSACEKCWSDAYRRSHYNGKPQADNYRELLEERKDNPCSAAEQRGTAPFYSDNERTLYLDRDTELAERLNAGLAGRTIVRVEYVNGTVNFVTTDADAGADDPCDAGLNSNEPHSDGGDGTGMRR